MAAKTKKRNPFAAYFTPFGLKQLCDILMLGGAVVVLVGIFVSDIVIAVGLGIFAVASAIAIIRSVKVLLSKINKRSPEYKNAVINTVVMSVFFALSLFGFIYSFFI